MVLNNDQYSSCSFVTGKFRIFEEIFCVVLSCFTQIIASVKAIAENVDYFVRKLRPSTPCPGKKRLP